MDAQTSMTPITTSQSWSTGPRPGQNPRFSSGISLRFSPRFFCLLLRGIVARVQSSSNAPSTTPQYFQSGAVVILPSSAQPEPCFPSLSCQNFLEANRKPFSIASLNSSHTRVSLSAATEAAALLPCVYHYSCVLLSCHSVSVCTGASTSVCRRRHS